MGLEESQDTPGSGSGVFILSLAWQEGPTVNNRLHTLSFQPRAHEGTDTALFTFLS